MIISFASTNGGVGKTTSCVNLAYALATGKPAKKILIIDFDSQCGTTHHLSAKFAKKFKASLYDVLQSKCQIAYAIHTYEENLDFIPVSFQFHEIASLDFESKLQEVLKEVCTKYHFLFFDLSPAIYPGSTIPLILSNYAIIPVNCSGGLSLLGLTAQAQLIGKIRKQKNKDLDVLGILPCFVDRTKVSIEVLAYLTQTYKDDVLPCIRRNTLLAQASSIGKTIFEHKKSSSGAKDYSNLAKEFLKRVKGKENE